MMSKRGLSLISSDTKPSYALCNDSALFLSEFLLEDSKVDEAVYFGDRTTAQHTAKKATESSRVRRQRGRNMTDAEYREQQEAERALESQRLSRVRCEAKNAVLQVVASTYYRHPAVFSGTPKESEGQSESSDAEGCVQPHKKRRLNTDSEPAAAATTAVVELRSSLDPVYRFLCDPLARQRHTLDLWTPENIALYETGICCFGKEFAHIQATLLPHLSVNDLADFYYQWKKSTHYFQWKEWGKVKTGLPLRRIDQAKKVSQILREGVTASDVAALTSPRA
jgi:hypothetical protein